MSVVDVDGDFLIEFADIHAGTVVVTDNGLSACGNEEVFLNQAHPLAFVGAVVGVKVFGN